MLNIRRSAVEIAFQVIIAYVMLSFDNLFHSKQQMAPTDKTDPCMLITARLDGSLPHSLESVLCPRTKVPTPIFGLILGAPRLNKPPRLDPDRTDKFSLYKFPEDS